MSVPGISVVWSDDKVLLLIQEYEKRRLLWDNNHKYYRDRNIRVKHLNELANILNVNVSKIKRKIKSLLGRYRNILSRLHCCEKDGDIIGVKRLKRWKWFKKLQFLPDRIKQESSTEWSDDKVLLLIQEYEKRRLLWDKNHQDYRDQNIRVKHLNELANILNVNVSKVKEKLHTILGVYRKRIPKLQYYEKNGDTKGVKRLKKWKWFTKLQFLSQKFESKLEWSHDKIMLFMREYKTRRQLWDYNHKDYYNKELREKYLNELANILRVPAVEVKNRIKYFLHTIRDRKKKEQELIEIGDTQGAKNISKWKWFPIVDFLWERGDPKNSFGDFDKYTDILLIKEYKKRRSLWDETHEYYSIRKHRENEWKKLAEAMNMERVKTWRRMQIILNRFREAWQKIQELEEEGDKKGVQGIWKRKWFSSLTFLINNKEYKSVESENNEMGETTETARNNINIKMEIEEAIEIKDENETEDCSSGGAFETYEESMSQHDDCSSSDAFQTHKGNTSQLDVSQMTDFQTSIYNEGSILSWNRSDECENFGLHVADRLRNFTKIDRASVIHDINNLIYIMYMEGLNETFNKPVLGTQNNNLSLNLAFVDDVKQEQ